MMDRISIAEIWRKSRWPLLLLAGFLYVAHSGMTGQNGYLAKQQVLEETAARQAELEALREDREALEKKVSLMSPDHLDRDLLDEQARAVLGLAGKDQLVILPDEE